MSSNPELERYRELVRDEVREITRSLTRVMLGELDTVVRSRHDDELFGHLAHMVNGVIERAREARTELERSRRNDVVREGLLRDVIDGASEAIYVKDRAGRFVLINEAGARLFGATPDQVCGKTLAELMPARVGRDIRDAEISVMETGVPRTDHFSVPFDDGDRTLLSTKTPYREADGGVIGVVGICRDVTDGVEADRRQRELEEQLRQSQKMEAVGQLAGGVAHDFNNILTALIGCSEGLRDRVREEDREAVEMILTSADRAASLTEKLLTFSRKQITQPRVLDLNVVAAEVQSILARVIGEDIELIVQSSPTPAWVEVDPIQIEQVLMNLALNARDAMPRGGRLEISVSEVASTVFEPDFARGAVVLEVRDTGEGMDQATLARAFDPFFTTKPTDQGTGLGLSMVYGIVQESGGRLFVESTPGEGAVFRIYLPPATEVPSESEADGMREPRRGSETILLVEDSDQVRRLARRILESAGYQILEARDGRDALELFHRSPRVDLLVTDVVMPHVGGDELVDRLRVGLPGLRVLFMSGYAPRASIRARIREHCTAFLQKPFRPLELLHAVGDLLDGKTSLGVLRPFAASGLHAGARKALREVPSD